MNIINKKINMINEENKSSMKIIHIIAVILIIAGIYGGYSYGKKVGNAEGVIIGVAQGRTDLLAEQAKAEQEKLLELQKAANPFLEAKDVANPFKGTYTNPFAQ